MECVILKDSLVRRVTGLAEQDSTYDCLWPCHSTEEDLSPLVPQLIPSRIYWLPSILLFSLCLQASIPKYSFLEYIQFIGGQRFS